MEMGESSCLKVAAFLDWFLTFSRQHPAYTTHGCLSYYGQHFSFVWGEKYFYEYFFTFKTTFSL